MVPFLIAAVLTGFDALLTPCVLPVVPLSLSYFLARSGTPQHRPVLLAAVYGLGILGAIIGLGMLVSFLGSPAAIHRLSSSGWLCVAIGGVFVFFGLKLLGLDAIRTPSWLLKSVSGKESRWEILCVLCLALTSTLISFTCTFAFMGVLLTKVTLGEGYWPILGVTAFSASLAIPFFCLALLPEVLRRIPGNGRWLNAVKVVLGLIDLGAALSFFGMADRSWHETPWLFDFQLAITVWIIISLSAGIYLLGLFRLSHDNPRDHIGVLRCVSAITCFGLAADLAVGLVAAQKPNGKLWMMVSSFAPPHADVENEPPSPYLVHGSLKYALDFHRAMDFAAKEKRPVLLQFSGVNNGNCREMENDTLSQPVMVEHLNQFVRIQLFIDRLPYVDDEPLAERLLRENNNLQQIWLGDVTMPAFAIVPPELNSLNYPNATLATFTGLGKVDEFSEFLDQGLKRWHSMNNVGTPVIGKR